MPAVERSKLHYRDKAGVTTTLGRVMDVEARVTGLEKRLTQVEEECVKLREANRQLLGRLALAAWERKVSVPGRYEAEQDAFRRLEEVREC